MALKAHTGFEVLSKGDITQALLGHFSDLGYRLTNQQPEQWIFQRGNKLAALWRFDIRAYATTLTVRSSIQQDGKRWVSCNWEVYTFMNLTTGGDVGTLEAEGRALESALREQA